MILYTSNRHFILGTFHDFLCIVEPCPSIVLQNIFRKMLLTEQEASTRFLDTLINQLNWSFSEFIGLMQEVNRSWHEMGGGG